MYKSSGFGRLALIKDVHTYIFFGGVMDAMCGPEKIDFVRHSVEPVVSHIDTQEGNNTSPNILFNMVRSPVRINVAVNTEF